MAEYWIVDQDARLVQRWRLEDERPEIVGEMLSWHPPAAPERLVIDLPGFFREVLGEA